MPQPRDHEEEAKPFLEADWPGSHQQSPSHKRSRRGVIVVPWILAALSWLITIYLLLSQKDYGPKLATSRENVTSFEDNQASNTYYPTDFKALRSSVSYETRQFTGGLYYDIPTKRFIRNATVDGPEYFGPPSEAIDEAWETLLDSEWSPMTDDESLFYRPELKTFNGFYRFETDMFHSLHCVNEIRKRIDSDYYAHSKHKHFKLAQHDWDRIHIDHCLDQLRQTVVCFGDLSPVPLYSWPGAPLGIGQGKAHTCRKWDPVRQWVDQRRLDMNDTA